MHGISNRQETNSGGLFWGTATSLFALPGHIMASIQDLNQSCHTIPPCACAPLSPALLVCLFTPPPRPPPNGRKHQPSNKFLLLVDSFGVNSSVAVVVKKSFKVLVHSRNVGKGKYCLSDMTFPLATEFFFSFT